MGHKLPKGKPTTLIDNDRVRVTEWKFIPDAETGYHRHEFDYVIVPLADGVLKIIDPEGKESFSQLSKGVPYFRPAGVEHNVLNASGTDYSFIEIEIR